ncbi:hypothetical protein ES705_39879 [subsurface metagenome]
MKHRVMASEVNVRLKYLISAQIVSLQRLFLLRKIRAAQQRLLSAKSRQHFFETVIPDPGSVTLKTELYHVKEGENSLIRSREHDLSFNGSHAKHIEIIKKKDLAEGDYLIKYRINAGEQTREIEKKFSIVWYGKPVFLYDLDMAILPMRYLLLNEEWEKVNDFSEEEREQWFNKFWKNKDPDVETPLNEVLVEFYHRVSRSNKEFRSENYEGWDTDRGKSLILYGDPDRIASQHYLDNAKPYEIWYYESKNKKLIFIDEDEDDTFHLVSIEEIGEKNE